MPLKPLQSQFFMVDGKYFQAVSVDDFDRNDCIDTIINLQTRERFKIRRTYTLAKPITWLTRNQVEHLNPYK